MSITKEQLNNMIKEELETVLEEGFGDAFKKFRSKQKRRMPQQSSDDDVARAFVRRMKGAGMQDTSVTTDKEYAERFSSAKRRKLEEETDEVDLNKEVMIDGYGSLTLRQIQRRMAKMLADAAEEAQQEPPSFRTLNNGVLIAMYKTLRDHNATNDIFLKENETVLKESLDYFDKSRDICKRRGSGYRDSVEMVRWDQDHAIKILNASRRRPEDYREAAKSCQCQDGTYFDPQDPEGGC